MTNNNWIEPLIALALLVGVIFLYRKMLDKEHPEYQRLKLVYVVGFIAGVLNLLLIVYKIFVHLWKG